MKKKSMLFALGMLSLCSIGFAQINVPNQTITNSGGTFIVSGTVTNVNPNTTLTLGTAITFQMGSSTTNYFVNTAPSNNPPGLLSAIESAINNAFNAAGVIGAGNATFGNSAGQVSLTWIHGDPIEIFVPFDFGLSAVLGAGAIAAVKAARRRKKEQEAIA